MFPFIYNNTWITDDKVLHFIFAFFITFLLYILFQYINKKSLHRWFSEERIFIYILFILFFLGIGKEIRDSIIPWHNVEFMDILTNYFWMLFFYLLKFLRSLFIKN